MRNRMIFCSNELNKFTFFVFTGVVGSGAAGELIWLCKICHEQREIWKKSGAWFFKVKFYFSFKI
jgi:hypothetical protein